MPSPRSRIGQSAEIVAASELGKRGYRIVASNYRCTFGEIDLIASDRDTLVFIEVRCKRTRDYGTPAESITSAKRQKLITTAQHYLVEHNLDDINCRFDVVEVAPVNGKLTVVDVVRDAFSV